MANKRRILILGASGFIGSRVVEKLSASDWAIPIAATHRTSLKRAISVPTVQVDARQTGRLREVLQGVDSVVNCITADSQTIVASAEALFSLCSRLMPARRIVHLSTIMVYGSATGFVDETAALKGDWDDYSAAKAEVERMANRCESVVHLRPGIVYGPGSPIWSGRIGRWLRQRRLGDLGEFGSGFCNLVHVDDVVDAVQRALRSPDVAGGAFNLSLPVPPTWNEYFVQYSAAIGTTAHRVSHTQLIFEQHFLGPPLKVAEIVSRILPFDWQPPEPIRPWLLRLCKHPLRMNVSKAERVLGIEWTPLEVGLRQSAEWLQSQETT